MATTAREAQRILGSEQRRIAPQQAPAFGAQYAMQIDEVAIDGFQIWVLAGEQRLHITIRMLEFALQAFSACFTHESRRLAQQIQSRAVTYLHYRSEERRVGKE